MAYIEAWDETKPAGTRDANLGDDDIREFKRAMRERLAGGGMYFPSTDDADAGLYNSLKFIEQSSNPTSEANRAFLFCKDVSGVTELYWMDSAGSVIQLTTGGKILISSLAIASEARGDIILRDASAWARKALGASGTFLRSDGTDLQYSTIQPGDITTDDLPAGSVLQTVSAQTGALDSTATALPINNNTRDVSSEGKNNTALNVTITPGSNSNYLIIEGVLFIGVSQAAAVAAMLGKDSVSAPLAVGRNLVPNASTACVPVPFYCKLTSPGTSLITFKPYFGSEVGTAYLNGTQGFPGGIDNAGCLSWIKVTEIKG